MKNMRGIIALVIALVFGLLAARMVANYIKRTDVKSPTPPPIVKPEIPVPISPSLPFAEAIPDGMRAVSIPVDEVTGVSRRVHRGDRVDVIAVSAVPNEDGGRISRLLLQAVEVLSAWEDENKTGGPLDGNRPSPNQRSNKWVVTLLLSPEDAATVTAADASGKLALIVRNPKDIKPEEKGTAMVFTNEDGARPWVKRRKWDDMADVRDLIAPGMRAFTVEAKVTDGAGGSIHPGDRVDVVLTCPFGHFSAPDHDVGAEGRITSTHMASRIFLQNIEVLAVADHERVVTQPISVPPGIGGPVADTGFQPDEIKTETIKSVVLQITPEQAEVLTVATDSTAKSIIRLLLRNPEDTERVVTKGQLLIELLTEKREYTSVEVFRGTEQKTRKFFHYTKGGIATRSEASRPLPPPPPRGEVKK